MLSLQRTGFLLSELCERLGLCLSPDARRTLLDKPLPDAASFTTAVFAAEGVRASPSSRDLYRDALALVERAYAEARPRDT